MERDVSAKIERARARRDAEQRVPKDMVHRATDAQRRELKRHGFRVTKKGVVVDRPRDMRRKPISGSRVEIMKGGIVKTSVKHRRDFIFGFTKKQRDAFALNPTGETKKHIATLEKLFPSLKKSRKKQIRLQWGAYQGTKDFAPGYFTVKYFSEKSPEETRRYGKRRATPRADKLTGLHIVIHVPKSSTADKQKRNRKRARRRKRK